MSIFQKAHQHYLSKSLPLGRFGGFMIRNYFKIALRHLGKNKLYAFVNIFGLAIGITSCLLIGIYIWHELSYDKFHKNADRIARVTWEYNFGDADTKTVTTGTRV